MVWTIWPTTGIGDAFQLFQEHSTHLRKEREQAQAKRQAVSRGTSQKPKKGQAASHMVKVSPRDPLLDYKRPRLVELLHEARAERDEAKRQVKAERSENEQRTQAARADLEQRYHKLLQEHMSCGITIAKLEAQGASILPFWSASDPHSNGRNTAKSCKEHPLDQTSQVASSVRLIARSTALGRRVSKSRSPTQSGWMKMRVMRG